MNTCSTQTSHRVKDQHFFTAPELFQDPAKHKDPEHVEKDMGQVGMHKNMGDNLMGLKKRGFQTEQGEMSEHEIF
jgi:hypothetical protein